MFNACKQSFGRMPRSACAVAIFLVSFLTLAFKSNQPSSGLRNQSNVVWVIPHSVEFLDYDWIGQTQLLYISKRQTNIDLNLVNTKTQIGSALSKATLELNSLRVNTGSGLSWQITACGKKLLIQCDSVSGFDRFVLTLGDQSVLKLPLPSASGTLCWFNGCDGVALFVRNKSTNTITLCNWIDGTNSINTIELPLRFAYPVGFRSDRYCFVSPLIRSNSVEISQTRLWPKVENLEKVVTDISNGWTPEMPIFSHNGCYLAWRKVIHSRIPQIKLLSRLPFFRLSYSDKQSIQILNLKTASVRTFDVSVDESGVSKLRWLGDDSSVSFISGDKVFVIAVK